jgi:DNA-binding SARP family transcriptional activator
VPKRSTPQLAKLTRPKLHKAVARERLFKLLDEAREHKPAICVVGPPGAGKTTLVASWLDARDIKGIWYQVDPGDADLATFFYYLGEAAKPFTRKGQRPLPHLTPEYLQDVEGFSRRFFRELFSRLPEGATLVLDNYQEISADQPFHPLIAQAVDEVPDGQTLVVVSRRDPPDCYARLIANENVAFVDWDALKLTLDEARTIAKAKGKISEPDLTDVHRRSDGWAAGLTLLLEEDLASGSKPEILNSGGMEAVFEYFATQIFTRLPQSTQTFLIDTAFLPRVTLPVAQALTGNSGAENILEDLYRRHLFTHRRPGDSPTYQYHALFQAFLRTQARRLLSSSEERRLASRASGLLHASGQTGDAIALYLESGDWESAARLIREVAPSLLAQGRAQTLRDWIGALPLHQAEDDPWLIYWLGASLIAVDQLKARRRLESAFNSFRKGDDTLGQMLAACGVIDSYYFEWCDFSPMGYWIAELERILPSVSLEDSPATELQVLSSLLVAMLYGQPGNPMLPHCVERVMQLLDLDIDINHRVMAATFLVSYSTLTGQVERAKMVVAKVEPLLEDSALTPLNQFWWRTRLGFLFWIVADYEYAARLLEEAWQISDVHGLTSLRSAKVLMFSYRLFIAIATGDSVKSEDCIRRMRGLLDSGSRMSVWHNVFNPLLFCLGQGNARPAFEGGAEAVRMSYQTGMIYIQVLSLIGEARGHAEFGTHENVMERLNLAGQLIRGTCLAHFESEILLVEAYSVLRHEGLTRGLSYLSSALEHARRTGYSHNGRWTTALPYLCAEALAAGIEVDYVREVIRQYRLRPPVADIEEWPWPVRIYTLGRFAIFREGQRLEFSGKAPRKPLALLKALFAFGGEKVPEERLTDALWPDEEADNARKSLDITALRLRKLLGSHEMVVVSDGSIGLNRRSCWTDVWAFERRVEQFEAGERERDAVQATVELFRGNFLPADSEEPWTAKARERIRNKFVRLIEVAAKEEETAKHWDKAIALYTKGLDADDLIEPFYQGLMRCYRAQGRTAEAMSAYRRLRQLLSVVLGIAPSDGSQALARSLQGDNPAHTSSS